MIHALIKLMRLYYSIPLAAGFLVILSYLVAGNFTGIINKAVFSFLSLLCMISAGYVFNDVCDIAVDRINCPNRVLAAGKLPRSTALIWSMMLFAAGLVLASLCGHMFFIGIAIVSASLICYDLLSKKIGFFKDIAVAAITTSLYPLAFLLTKSADTPRLNALYIFPVWLLLTSMGYEMLKDIRDAKGDCISAGREKSHCMSKSFLLSARMLIVTASVISLMPSILGYCGLIYLASSIAAVLLAVASAFQKPVTAIRLIYIEVFLITAGSMIDLMIYGP